MDSDDDDYSRLVRCPLTVRHCRKLVGMEPHELREIEVDAAVHNTCKSFNALPEEVLDLILQNVIGFYMMEGDCEDIIYYNIRHAQLLSNVNITMWRLMHRLPHINYETKSLNDISIYEPSEDVDADGDRLEQECGKFNGRLRVFKDASSVQRSVLWDKPILLDSGTKFEMRVRSFVNNQLMQNGESTILEVEWTFNVNKSVMEFRHDHNGRTVNKWAPISYETTQTRTYMPMQPVEIDEDDGKAWVDDEAPRRLLLTSATQNDEMKACRYPFIVNVNFNHSASVVRFQAKRRIAKAFRMPSDNVYFEYGAREVHPILMIFQHPIDMEAMRLRKQGRAARKRAIESFSKVRELEDETSIAAMMREHDEESIERTEEKRIKAAAPTEPAALAAAPVTPALAAPAAGSSSGVTSFESRLRAYVAARERRLKTEYEQLMVKLGGDNDVMIISQLKEVEGRIAELLSLRDLSTGLHQMSIE